jgi:hypothetical protein
VKWLLACRANRLRARRPASQFLAQTVPLLINHIRDSNISYVNIKAPTLAPLFRSDAQGELLANLFLNPQKSFTIAELARAAHTPYASAHREVSRILEMGLATSTKRGQSLEIRAKQDTAAFRPLAELLSLTYGPAVVIPNYLSGIPGIREAYIYGSWAARLAGEPGDSPGDIDLLIIGNPPRSAVYEAVRLASSSIAREINPRIVSEKQWATAADDPFLHTVSQRPLIQLDLEPVIDLEGLAP